MLNVGRFMVRSFQLIQRYKEFKNEMGEARKPFFEKNALPEHIAKR